MPEDLTVTWSGLKRYSKCHHAQKLIREGKRAKAKDGRVFLKGNLADHSMRRWLENGDFSVPVKYYLKPVWEDNTGPDAERPIKWKSPDDQMQVVEEVRESLDDLEEVLRREVIPFDYEPEFRFTTRVGIPSPTGEPVAVNIFAAIDVAVRYDENTIGLWDLKQSTNKSYVKSSIGQLVLYDLAVKNHLGIRPTRHGFFTPLLKKEPVIELDVTQADRATMVSDIINYAHGVWNNEWELTEDKNDCYTCDVRHACIRWHKPITAIQRTNNLTQFGQR